MSYGGAAMRPKWHGSCVCKEAAKGKPVGKKLVLKGFNPFFSPNLVCYIGLIITSLIVEACTTHPVDPLI
ncbi:predicted protein [Pyrenophora tritici-repentis Pt-1C-BFP]|uniref:Uncharacterized protein n=1 Tax=Pyrenophora tritici-repentis (strain Pt-1C-BFP) TaxID=426418 RepID=B2VT37_PYRTR|nr:uncharacterized protein PTRG_01873 [Pyrenophora tritici-repentis Pt-1C-BFP]EDU41311.1 predicted protein [Pyrenophora tritici-repentis Pt-1C-BFP]